VGAELERLRWGAATARRAGSVDLSVGAYVNVAVDLDRDRARELVRGSVATFARFSPTLRQNRVGGYDQDGDREGRQRL